MKKLAGSLRRRSGVKSRRPRYEPLEELPEERIISAGEVDTLVVERPAGHAEVCFCHCGAQSRRQFLTGHASAAIRAECATISKIQSINKSRADFLVSFEQSGRRSDTL